MRQLVISEKAFTDWRASMNELLPACCASQKEVLMLTDKLDELASNFAAKDEERTSTRAVTHDVATQLCTVSTVSFSRQVLRRMRAERTVRRLARDAGRLAALSVDCCDSLGTLMDLAVLGSAAMCPMMANDPSGAEASTPLEEIQDTIEARWSETAMRDAAAAQAKLLLSHLTTDATEAVCASSKEYRALRARLHRIEPSEEGAPHPRTPATTEANEASTFLERRLAKRSLEALQYFREHELSHRLRASRARAARPAFVCWRCRQDGRNNFTYNTEQRQLSKTMAVRQSGQSFK